MTMHDSSHCDSIIKALRLWGLDFKLDESGLNWESRDSLDCPREEGEESCSHPDEMSFQEFLDSNPADFSSYCGFTEDPEDDSLEEETIAALIGLASDIQAIESLGEGSGLSAFEDIANYPTGDFGAIPGLVKTSELSLSELAEERIFEQLAAFPKSFKEVLDGLLSQQGTWDVPELNPAKDSMVYAYSDSLRVSSDNHHASGLERLLKHFYTQVSPGLLILPEPLLRLRAFDEREYFENIRIRKFVAINPEVKEFYTLGGRPIEGLMPVEDSDDSAMREALSVFASEMPFVDAVKAARAL